VGGAGFGVAGAAAAGAAGLAAALGLTVRNFAPVLAKWYRWFVRSVVANSYSGVM
jgi:hypothetical protein